MGNAAKGQTPEDQKDEEKKTRHPKGLGSIYQRSNGTWVGQSPPLPGIKRKYFTGKSETIVKQKLKAYRTSPEYLTPKQNLSSETAEAYIRHFLKIFKSNDIKASSYDRLESTLNIHIIPSLKYMKIKDITSSHCKEILNAMRENEMAYSSIKKAYDAMKEIFRHAFNEGDISKNPMLNVKMPQGSTFQRENVRALTKKEENEILEEINKKWVSSKKLQYSYKNLFILILNTGLRCGECIALDWDDIDIEKCSMHIHKTAIFVKERDKNGETTHKSKQIVQETPKRPASNRIIPLNKKALAALAELKKEHPDSPYIATTDKKTRTSYHTISKQFTRAAKNCGVGWATLHTLRHTFATRLFEKGADVKTVSELLGHASVGITYDIYIHVIKERKNDVVALLDD